MALLAAWNFEEQNQSLGTFTDATGNGHDLTFGANASLVEGHTSTYAVQAASGTQSDWGAGAYSAYPGGSSQANPLTVMFWSKLMDMSTGTPCVCVWNLAGRNDPMNIYADTDGSVGTWWFDSDNMPSSGPVSVTSGLITTGIWAHVACVFVPGTGVTLYVNGSAATTYTWQSGTNAFYNSWETLLVGSSRWGSNGAIIDDLRIYDEVLSAGQITSLMNQNVGAVNNMHVGTTTPGAMYVGTVPVTKAYLGSNLVYRK